MNQLASVEGLIITQQKEWGEILSGFETVNRYAVSDLEGNRLFVAGEESGSFLARWFLKALRPFTIVVVDNDGQVVLRIARPFRFYFHQAEIFDGRGQSLGLIERRFSILRRRYSVVDPAGREPYQLFGPLLHPWTFNIRDENGVEHGKITKKWSGLLKEGFTDADTFGVTFPADWDVHVKALFLGAVFLIDFVHFEDTGS